ncbi:neurobeachin-like [Temnothorax curvispinosus]|uniref:Neurobeachin-like n=1 Tax=Temnothorax curvispinosus TaxID=300111 RepID=A0A6J1RLP6_9HYME|nr:neurobeachin-like [Temnothorax curvispinosus]
MSQSGFQDDGEYEVIIVDENNSSILADHDVTLSGPPSTKLSKILTSSKCSVHATVVPGE